MHCTAYTTNIIQLFQNVFEQLIRGIFSTPCVFCYSKPNYIQIQSVSQNKDPTPLEAELKFEV